MRIRNKISYIAFKKKMTIPQLIINQILKTFTLFKEEGSIKINIYKNKIENEIYNSIISGKKNVFKKLIKLRMSHNCCGDLHLKRAFEDD